MCVMTRRQFLTRATACAGYFAAAGVFSTLHSGFAWASASCTNNRKVLVHLFLDGGLDSASLLVPRNLQSYFDRRPNIQIANPIAIDSRYGLHPSLTNFSSLLSNGQLAIINKVGYPSPSRSHEESQAIYSRAIRNAGTTNTGWAGRFGDTYCSGNPNVASIMSFRGRAKDIAAQSYVATTAGSLAGYGYTNDFASSNDSRYRRNIIQYNRNVEPLQNDQSLNVGRAWNVIDSSVVSLQQVNSSYTSPVTYATDGLSQRLRDAAKLIRSPDANPSIILLAQGGYDTHGDEPTSLLSRFGQLNAAVGSFMEDLTQMGRVQDVQLHIYTEFGRNTFENSTRGTDHGHGTCAIVIGGNVRPGIHGPEYTEADFASRSFLPNVVDFREILSESLAEHLGVDPSPIFPEAFTRTGINVVG